MPTTQPFYSPKFRAFDDNGDPLSGGLLYTYAAGTSTPLATYTTRAGSVANANPVVLNANGEADVWLTANTDYKFELRDSAGVLKWTVDNVPAPADLSIVPLKLGDGTVSAPSLSFVNDPDCGIYRVGANNYALSVGGAKIVDVSSSGLEVTGDVVTTGGVAAGGSVTGSATGANNAVSGGANSSGAAVKGVNTGSGPAVDAGAGHLKLSGAEPASNTAFTSTVTPKNLIKAWATIAVTGGTPSVQDGFNITSVSRPTVTDIEITMASAMANANYGVFVTHRKTGTANYGHTINVNPSTTVFRVSFRSDGGAAFDFSTTDITFSVLVVG
jgi:hypothetical protein